MNLGVSLRGVSFEHPIINAAGTCKKLEDVQKLAGSAVAGLVVGSATVEQKPGNPGNVWHVTEYSTINSLGLPNPGAEYYKANLPEMVKIAHDHGKPLIFSVAGNTPREFFDLAEVGLEAGVDFVELNLGCPNKWDEGKQGKIYSYDPTSFDSIIRSFDFLKQLAKIGVKISPYVDPFMVADVNMYLRSYWDLAYVATANTFPNGFLYQENWRPAIDSENVPGGFGGVAGPGYKAIALGQVTQFRKLFDHPDSTLNNLPIIGIGGVGSGRDVAEYRQSGATLVGVASAYMAAEDPNVFGRILTEYVNLLDQKEPAAV